MKIVLLVLPLCFYFLIAPEDFPPLSSLSLDSASLCQAFCTRPDSHPPPLLLPQCPTVVSPHINPHGNIHIPAFCALVLCRKKLLLLNSFPSLIVLLWPLLHLREFPIFFPPPISWAVSLSSNLVKLQWPSFLQLYNVWVPQFEYLTFLVNSKQVYGDTVLLKALVGDL